MKRLVSVVVPFYNEEDCVDELHKRLTKAFKQESKYNFEIIAIEHGSTDSTFQKLVSINLKDKKLKILQLSRNFGNVDAAISAGLTFARGDAIVVIMGDLQEPPELISKFLRKWEQGFDVVYGIIKKRADRSLIRKINSLIYYKILRLASGSMFVEGASDYRLTDKKVNDVIKSMPERNKFLRGLVFWSGFKQIGISYSRDVRFGGESKADFFTVLKVAANGIFSFSYIPLRLVTLTGLVVSLISFSVILYEIFLMLVLGRTAPGIFTIVILVAFLFGVMFIILGIIGEYLVRIYDEAKQRPAYIIKTKIGLK